MNSYLRQKLFNPTVNYLLGGKQCIKLNILGLVRSSSATGKNEGKDEDAPLFDLSNPYKKPKKQCLFCKHNIKLDYKNPRLLSQFVSRFTGQVYGRHVTGLCSKQQELLEREIFLSRDAGFMPYEFKDVKYVNDPPLIDPFKFPPKRY